MRSRVSARSAWHYARDVFARAQIRRMFANKPCWAALENELYGSLIGRDRWWHLGLPWQRVELRGPH